MDAFFNSLALVFVGEMGDKTQLLALVLLARFRRPWVILAGVFVATVLNHALASWFGAWIASWVPTHVLSWILAASFLVFALWVLIPDKEGEAQSNGHFGVFLTTVWMFFMAEMGDKTQLATIVLGAQYGSAFWVTLGSTFGMMGSNALALFVGDRFLEKIPMNWVRIGASFLFFIFALVALWQGWRVGS